MINRFKQDPAVGPSQVVKSHASALYAMEEILHGSIWCMISRLLTTDGRGDVTDSDWLVELRGAGMEHREISSS